MNISEHISNFIQEMKRRNYAKNTIDNYVSCLQIFFAKINKDHPKNINECEIKYFLSNYSTVNTQRNYPAYSHRQAKECSLILVAEIIEELKEFDTMDGYSVARINFWNEVKAELDAFK